MRSLSGTMMTVALLAMVGCGDGATTPPAPDLSTPHDAGMVDAGAADAGSKLDGGGSDAATAPMTASIMVKDFEFLPSQVRIANGGTVTWTFINGGHTVTSGMRPTADGLFCNGVAQPTPAACSNQALSNQGDVFMHTFTTSGDFNFFCRPHGSMNGIVHVDP